jgi:hypothetical protein
VVAEVAVHKSAVFGKDHRTGVVSPPKPGNFHVRIKSPDLKIS